MTIYINSTYSGERTDVLERPDNNADLKSLLKETLNEKSESGKNIKWIDDNTLEINGVAPMALHTFVLKAEELGKEIKYTKKTIIEIS
ncbi:hypothetical protein [Fulvivirga lutea]|uniref:Uncharacterized protein n=1 Tax=Fulvivirga lutea TaxID=2810512 RepID=A0A975A2A0_9BACT|nr:hypothetical protein [Fulvivirga lutea]QSE99264.1 hypothetical protein JR347_09295 [Fulvivirga lutea]